MAFLLSLVLKSTKNP